MKIQKYLHVYALSKCIKHITSQIHWNTIAISFDPPSKVFQNQEQRECGSWYDGDGSIFSNFDIRGEGVS